MNDPGQNRGAPERNSSQRRRLPGRPPAEAEPRRQRIVSTAIDLFIASGFAGTTIDEIARQSGLNKRTIYTLVGDKEQLFREVCRHVALNGGLDLSDAIDEGSLRNSLINLGQRLMENSLSPQTIALEKTAIAAAPLFPDFIDELVSSNYREANTKVASFLAQIKSLGLAPVADEYAASELFFDLVVGQMAHRMLLGQKCHAPDQHHLEQRVDLFVSYLLN